MGVFYGRCMTSQIKLVVKKTKQKKPVRIELSEISQMFCRDTIFVNFMNDFFNLHVLTF